MNRHVFSHTPPEWRTCKAYDYTYRSRTTNLSGRIMDGGKLIARHFDGRQEEIDFGIWPLIAELNRNGFETMTSCSGLPEDHDPIPTDVYGCGYIQFMEPVTEELLSLVPRAFYLERVLLLRVGESIEPDDRRKAWAKWLTNLRRYRSKNPAHN